MRNNFDTKSRLRRCSYRFWAEVHILTWFAKSCGKGVRRKWERASCHRFLVKYYLTFEIQRNFSQLIIIISSSWDIGINCIPHDKEYPYRIFHSNKSKSPITHQTKKKEENTSLFTMTPATWGFTLANKQWQSPKLLIMFWTRIIMYKIAALLHLVSISLGAYALSSRQLLSR